MVTPCPAGSLCPYCRTGDPHPGPRDIKARACPHDTYVSCFDDTGRRRCGPLCACLCHQPIDVARFEKAPCYLCDYNGEKYFQPDTHACAARYHEAQAAKIDQITGDPITKLTKELGACKLLLEQADQALKTQLQVTVTARQAVSDVVVQRNALQAQVVEKDEAIASLMAEHEKVMGWYREECDRGAAAIPMRLPCPSCGELHVDVEFAAKRHHTHACQHCGMVWRPAVGPTVGVRFLPGFKDAEPPQ